MLRSGKQERLSNKESNTDLEIGMLSNSSSRSSLSQRTRSISYKNH